MRTLRSAFAIGTVAVLASTLVAACSSSTNSKTTSSSGGTTGGANSSSGSGAGSKNLYVIGAYQIQGEGDGITNSEFDDGAKLAVKDLDAQGWNVKYERISTAAGDSNAVDQAFLQVQDKKPDAWMGMTVSSTLITEGPKVAKTDIPTIAMGSPSQGVKNGVAGGPNIFLLRPLYQQVYSQLLKFVCVDLKQQLNLPTMKIALNSATNPFGQTTVDTVNGSIGKYSGCTVVKSLGASFTATDLTANVLAIKNSGANVVLDTNAPGPDGVLVNQLRQNGVNLPVVGAASLNLAVQSGAIHDRSNLWVADDCVPELDPRPTVQAFVKEYTKAYGAPPTYEGAEVYDAYHMLANAITKTGSHDWKAIDAALATTDYQGICTYKTDANNVLSNSVTIYKYKSASDPTKVLVQKDPVEYIPLAGK